MYSKRILSVITIAMAATMQLMASHIYYVSPTGKDTNTGTIKSPLATFGAAYKKACDPGDTVYFRAGTYKIQESEIMTPGSGSKQYSYVFDLKNSGDEAHGRIMFAGYPGERPVFDFSAVKPKSRISAFCLHASYIHLRNFDIVGVQATMHGHYQSECISGHGGSHCIVENIAMHDNMSIGYYANRGSYNQVINCDAYCNYDDYGAFRDLEGYTADENYQYYKQTGNIRRSADGKKRAISETLGGNCDGFGFHALSKEFVGNIFRGCRAWWNSDDGFDCINSKTKVIWEDCWAFYNGYEPHTAKPRGDGNGFKAGGYAMKVPCRSYPKYPDGTPNIPENLVRRCIAYYNKAAGFYANHHLGGNRWENNTAMYNSRNFQMLNRKIEGLDTIAVNVEGYEHVLVNNVSYHPRVETGALVDIDMNRCSLENNCWNATQSDFVSVAESTVMDNIPLAAPRKPDGSLPDINFLVAVKGGNLEKNHQGALFSK